MVLSVRVVFSLIALYGAKNHFFDKPFYVTFVINDFCIWGVIVKPHAIMTHL